MFPYLIQNLNLEDTNTLCRWYIYRSLCCLCLSVATLLCWIWCTLRSCKNSLEIFLFVFSSFVIINTCSFIYWRPLKSLVVWFTFFLFVGQSGNVGSLWKDCTREGFLRNWHQSLLLLLFKQEKKTNWHLIFPGKILLFSQLLLRERERQQKPWFFSIVAIRSVCWALTCTWHSL